MSRPRPRTGPSDIGSQSEGVKRAECERYLGVGGAGGERCGWEEDNAVGGGEKVTRGEGPGAVRKG